ncbi:MAG: NADH-quinone oxidoreductase subunit J [Chloroflexi bacterium]|nr:NADH-quinone oxidoreductase subunit J [Chloroflexota bacterium]
MELILFFITAAIAVAGAVAMLLSPNAIHSALFLLLNFVAISVLYLLLRAPFLFAVQLIVYAGAIIVLFIFVVMLLGAEHAEDERERIAWQRPLGLTLAAMLLGLMGYIVLRGDQMAPVTALNEQFASPERIAAALFTTYLLPFEITAFLLLAAVVGVVVLHLSGAKRT